MPYRARRSVATVLLACAAGTGLALTPATPAGAATVTRTFTAGADQPFHVPPGVTELSVVAVGAAGTSAPNAGAGGRGAARRRDADRHAGHDAVRQRRRRRRRRWRWRHEQGRRSWGRGKRHPHLQLGRPRAAQPDGRRRRRDPRLVVAGGGGGSASGRLGRQQPRDGRQRRSRRPTGYQPGHGRWPGRRRHRHRRWRGWRLRAIRPACPRTREAPAPGETAATGRPTGVAAGAPAGSAVVAGPVARSSSRAAEAAVAAEVARASCPPVGRWRWPSSPPR